MINLTSRFPSLGKPIKSGWAAGSFCLAGQSYNIGFLRWPKASTNPTQYCLFSLTIWFQKLPQIQHKIVSFPNIIPWYNIGFLRWPKAPINPTPYLLFPLRIWFLSRFCKQGTLQFCIIKPLMSFIVIILQVIIKPQSLIWHMSLGLIWP